MIKKRNELQNQLDHHSSHNSHDNSFNVKNDQNQKKNRVKVLKKQITADLGNKFVDMFTKKKINPSKEKLTFGHNVDPNIDNDTWNR